MPKLEPNGRIDSHSANEVSDSSSAWRKELFDTIQQHPLQTGLATAGLAVLTIGTLRYGLGKQILPRLVEDSIPATHLTNEVAATAIQASGKIGGRWGVFVLDSDKIPPSQFMRQVKTLVPRDLSAQVQLPVSANSYLERPFPVGPFSVYRNLGGVRNSQLGSISLETGQFAKNEIFADGEFRRATLAEINQFEIHQFILDYGIDGGLWLDAAAASSYLK